MDEKDFLVKYIEERKKITGKTPPDQELVAARDMFRLKAGKGGPTGLSAVVQSAPAAVMAGFAQTGERVAGSLAAGVEGVSQGEYKHTVVPQSPMGSEGRPLAYGETRRGIQTRPFTEQEKVLNLQAGQELAQKIRDVAQTGGDYWRGVVQKKTENSPSGRFIANATTGVTDVLGTMALSAITGPAAPLATGALYASSSYDEFVQKARKEMAPEIKVGLIQSGKSNEEATVLANKVVEDAVKDKAFLNALLQGSLDAASQYIFMGAFPQAGKLIAGKTPALANAITRGLSKMSKPTGNMIRFLGNWGLQQGQEEVQAVGQRGLEIKAGIKGSGLTPAQEAKEQRTQTVAITGLLSVLGLAGDIALSPRAKKAVDVAQKAPTKENIKTAIIETAPVNSQTKEYDSEAILAIADNLANGVYTSPKDAEADLAQIKNEQHRDRIRKNVVAKHFSMTQDPVSKVDIVSYSPKNRVWNKIKNDIVFGSFDISGLKSVNSLADHPEWADDLTRAAEHFGVPGETNAYKVGNKLKKNVSDMAHKINKKYGNRFEFEIKAPGSDEFVVTSRTASNEELGRFLEELKASLPSLTIRSTQDPSGTKEVGKVSTAIIDPKPFATYEDAYTEAFNIKKGIKSETAKPQAGETRKATDVTPEETALPDSSPVTEPSVSPIPSATTTPLQNATQDFGDLIADLQVPVEQQKTILQTLRENTPEDALTKLNAQGINVTLEQLKKLDPMAKGGAGERVEIAEAIKAGFNDILNNTTDLAKQIVQPNVTEAQVKEKLDQWFAANKREGGDAVENILNWADVQNAQNYIARQEELTGGGLRLAHERTNELLAKRGLTYKDLNRLGNDASDILLKSAAITQQKNELAVALKKITEAMFLPSTDPVQKAKLQKAGKALLTKLKDLNLKDRTLSTDIARALEFKKTQKNTEAGKIISSLNELLKTDRIEDLTDLEVNALFDGIRRAKNPGEIIDIAEPTIFDVLLSGYYASILSGISTHAKNIISTAINTGTEQFVTAATQPYNIKNQTKAISRGIRQGVKQAGEAFKSPSVGTSKFDLTNPRATNKLMKAFDIVGRTLSAEDAFFRAINYEASLSGLAAEEARMVTGGKIFTPAYTEAYKKFMENPTDEMIRQARYEAARNIFNQDPEGVIGFVAENANKIASYEWFSGINPKLNVKPGKVVLPFTRVVANVLNAGVDWTPLGLKRAAEYKTGKMPFQGEGRYANRDATRQLARVLLGSAAMAALYGISDREKTTITGSGPRSKTAREQLRLTGWRPNSIRIGKTYVPYYNLGPVGLGLAIVGNFKDSQRYKKLDEKEAIEKVISVLIGVTKTILNQSFLAGVSDVVEAINDDNEKALFRTVMSPVTAINPNLIRQINDFFDNTKYERPENFTAYLLNELRPFGKIGGNQIQPQINLMGEDVKKDSNVFGRAIGIPVTTPKEKEYTPILDYVTRAGGKLRGPSNTFQTPDGVVELKDRLWTEYRRVRGQNYRKEIYEIQQDLRNAEDITELQYLLDLAAESATSDAQEYMIETYPEELKQYIIKKGEK